MAHHPRAPETRNALERRARLTTLRTLLFALCTLLLTGWAALMASECFGIDSWALQFASPLLTVWIVASTALHSWSKAWAALESASRDAFRWAVFQAARSKEANAYFTGLLELRRPMLQHDVWCLKEIQRNHMTPTDLAEPELDAREQLTA